MTHVIQLNHVAKYYDRTLQILTDVSYCFEKGKLYCVVGASGVGKTTLLQIIGTLDTASSGEVIIEENVIQQMKDKQKAELRNKKIGFVFQSFFLNPKLNAVENVMLPMLITDKHFTECKQRANMLLELVGLSDRASHYPYQLSGGEQQRVAVARALANSPSIILADEPTGNLDEENELKLLEIFRKLVNNGMTIVMVTHNKNILSYADEVLQLVDGRLGT